MELIVNGDRFDSGISDEFLEDKLKSLTGKGDSFIILARDEMSYMQASGCFHDGFTLEYQEGSLDHHFACITEPLSNSQVVSAFNNYLNENGKWKTNLSWEREDLNSHQIDKPHGGRSSSLYVVVLVFVTAFIWYLVNNA